MQKLVATIAALALLTGCATRGAGYVPLVDTQGKQQDALDNDVAQCQQYAQQRASAGTGAIIGAVIGGLLGAALAVKGYRNEVAGRTAAFGALGGAAEATETQETIIKRCLAGRGYNVLN